MQCLTKHFVLCPYVLYSLSLLEEAREVLLLHQQRAHAVPGGFPTPSQAVHQPKRVWTRPLEFRAPFFHPLHPHSALSNVFGAVKVGLVKGNDETQSGPVWESRKSFSGLLLAGALTRVETLVNLFSI